MTYATNGWRAAWALASVANHSDLTGVSDEDMPPQISALLCNLCHLMKEEDVDPEGAFQMAFINFNAECDEEDAA